MKRRGWMVWAVIVVAVLAVVLVAGRDDRDNTPLDPEATGPLGAKQLVVLLRELDATVDVTDAVPTAQDGRVALVLSDDLSDDQRNALVSWVRAGGVLVVADPFSSLALAEAAFPENGLVEQTHTPAGSGCAVPAVAGVGQIDVGASVGFESVPSDSIGCFEIDSKPWLVASAEGRGTVVSLGSPGPFVNKNLRKRDNAELIAALVAPRATGTVTWLRPSADAVATGKGIGVDGLISPRVKPVLWTLAIAMAVYALYRARRLGRVVDEPLPVELRSSDLVLAVGRLLQQGRHVDRAAAHVRAQARRVLGERLGLGPRAGADAVSAAAAARTGTDREQLFDALTDRPVGDEAALLALAQTLSALVQEVTHA